MLRFIFEILTGYKLYQNSISMKTGFWLRNGKGKLAGATVYQSNGETVMREIVSPSNPQTVKQTIQRIIMHTVGQAYSLFKEICDHSFEGMKQGRDCMTYFMKQNLQFCREKVSEMQGQGMDLSEIYNFSRLGHREVFMNQYQVAMGSLPSVNVTIGTGTNPFAKIAAVTENTYAGVIEALGLKRGDQLTFMAVDHSGIGVAGQTREFHYCRVILDPINADGSQASLDVPFIADNAINLPSFRNEGSMEFGFDGGVNFRTLEDRILDGVSVIVSRQAGDSWLRSTAYMVYNFDNGFSLQDCLDAAQNTSAPIYAPNEQYLNNAGEGAGSTPAAEISVEGVAFDGNAATAGTEVAYTVNVGDTKSVVTTVTLANAPEGTAVKIIKSGETAAAASGATNAQGVATITHAYSAGTYNVVYVANDEDVATGYSFKITETSGGGGFGG